MSVATVRTYPSGRTGLILGPEGTTVATALLDAGGGNCCCDGSTTPPPPDPDETTPIPTSCPYTALTQPSSITVTGGPIVVGPDNFSLSAPYNCIANAACAGHPRWDGVSVWNGVIPASASPFGDYCYWSCITSFEGLGALCWGGRIMHDLIPGGSDPFNPVPIVWFTSGAWKLSFQCLSGSMTTTGLGWRGSKAHGATVFGTYTADADCAQPRWLKIS